MAEHPRFGGATNRRDFPSASTRFRDPDETCVRIVRPSVEQGSGGGAAGKRQTTDWAIDVECVGGAQRWP